MSLEAERSDPLYDQDPWQSRQEHGGCAAPAADAPQPAAGSWAWQPNGDTRGGHSHVSQESRWRNTRSRVDPDDELSDSQTESQPTAEARPEPRYNGYTTPATPRGMAYAGAAEVLPTRREGGPTTSERQLQNILMSRLLRQAHAAQRRAVRDEARDTAREEGSIRRLHLLRHGLPISVAPSRSAVPVSSVTQQLLRRIQFHR